MSKGWPCLLGGLVGLTLWLSPGDARAVYVTTVVMSGLDNPRGLAFGPDGGLYVAESGSGGDGPSVVLGTGETNFYGASGAVSRLLNGVQERIITGLPSLAPDGGVGASGLQDIAFSSSGEAFGVIGFGGDPALRAQLGAVGADFGQLVRLNLAGGPVQAVADVAAYEASENPDGTVPDSNPFGLLVTPDGGFIVADAGANAVVSVTPDGVLSTLTVVPPGPNPLPFGPPFYQGVPTSVAQGPDGALYIGQLTGFPFPPGSANVYRLDPQTGELTVAFSGFTTIVDLTFGPDGSLYVLDHTTNGLALPPGPGPGALFRIDPSTGDRSLIASEGLNFPIGVVVVPDNALYVTNQGTSPGEGQVLRITAVPEPSTFALMGLGLVGLVGYAWRRR